MSQATDFLQAWIVKAHVRAPSITRTTTQRWPTIGTPPNFKPGITSYGWGINGSLVKDGNGHDVGLRFAVDVWFSDRGLDLGHAPPNSGSQFKSNASDKEVLTFTIVGDAVQVEVRLVTWNSTFTATTTQIDAPSQQLIFSNLPPAGPVPVRAILIVSFADTGRFGWL